MKRTILYVVVVSLFALAVSKSAQAQCSNSYTEPGTGFTFCPPAGWTSRKDAGDSYSTFYGPSGNDGLRANINVRQEATTLSLDEYVIASMKYIFMDQKNKGGFTKIAASDISDFKTTSGISGVRVTYQVELKGSAMRSFQYIFDRGGTMKFLVTGTVSDANLSSADVIESAVKTVVIAK